MKEKLKKILIVLFATVAVCCAGYLIWYYVVAGQADESYEKAKVEAKKDTQVIEQPDMGEAVDIPIDFASLKATNPDVYAWIQIDGTNIDYPIVQRIGDDNYYLNHTWEGANASQGAIFTQSCNGTDFMDFNTAVYGHQMGDGNESMFHNLGNFLDPDYFNEHSQIVIYTPEHILTYTIFAAVVYDDRHLVQSFNFSRDSERQAFIDSIYNARSMQNQYRDGVEVTTKSRVLSLSTCVSGADDKRMLVEAVLTDEK